MDMGAFFGNGTHGSLHELVGTDFVVYYTVMDFTVNNR